MNVENGNTVSFHYVGTLDDGTEFDNSITRGEPLTSQIGQGQMIPGFESALLEMEVGEKKSVSINANKKVRVFCIFDLRPASRYKNSPIPL